MLQVNKSVFKRDRRICMLLVLHSIRSSLLNDGLTHVWQPCSRYTLILVLDERIIANWSTSLSHDLASSDVLVLSGATLAVWTWQQWRWDWVEICHRATNYCIRIDRGPMFPIRFGSRKEAEAGSTIIFCRVQSMQGACVRRDWWQSYHTLGALNSSMFSWSHVKILIRDIDAGLLFSFAVIKNLGVLRHVHGYVHLKLPTIVLLHRNVITKKWGILTHHTYNDLLIWFLNHLFLDSLFVLAFHWKWGLQACLFLF